MFCGIYNGIHLHILLYVLCVGLRCVRSLPSDRSPPPSPFIRPGPALRPSASPIRRAQRTVTGCGRGEGPGRSRDSSAAGRHHHIAIPLPPQDRNIVSAAVQQNGASPSMPMPPCTVHRDVVLAAVQQSRDVALATVQ